MIRILTCTNSKVKNAGPKAKEDIAKILKNKYQENIKTKTMYEENDSNKMKKTINLIKKIFFIIINCWLNNDKIIIQYPMSNQTNLLKLFPKKRTIIVIHDLQGLRLLDKNKEQKEINLLKKYKYLIVHNDSMKEYLVEKGFDTKNIFLIEIFDYLSLEIPNIDNIDKTKSVAFVGNLAKEKSPFIHQLETKKMKFKMYLYGVGINSDINTNIQYKGSYNPDELPCYITQRYGLVWDGNYDESDENVNYKNYLKYNNPHKLSCYIAAGIPVIVWKKSAMADFVKKYDIGYLIENIYEINNIRDDDYNIKKKNVIALSGKIRKGYFTNSVFDKIIK